MSLINKMLKDLDRRVASSENQDAKKNLLSGLTPSISSGKKPIIPLRLLLVLLIIIVLVTFFIYSNTQKQENTVILDKKISLDQPLVSANNLSVAKEEVTLNNFTLDSGPEVAYLRLALSKTTNYFVANNNSNQPILLTLTNTKLIPNLENMIPKLSENNWISKLKFEQLAGALIIEIIPMPNVELIKAEIKNEPEVLLSMHFGKKNSTISENGTMKKMILPLTPEETTKQQYQQSVELTVSNQIPEAIAKLQKLLASDPSYIAAREALATLLLKTGKSAQASKVLADGLARDPESLILIKLRAQILTNENKLEAALKLLREHHPKFNQEPEYYGFIASLYQRTGQFILAAKLYDQLVKLQPYNAIWWVGLGTALESNGENNAAIEAYNYALRSGTDLSPEVHAYVKGKANQMN